MIMAMPSPCRELMPLLMPTPLATHLWPTSPCPGACPSSPDPAGTSHRPRRAQQSPGQDVPSDAQARQHAHGHATGTLERRLVADDLPLTSPFTHPLARTPGSSQTCSPARTCPFVVVLVSVLHHGTARTLALPARSRPPPAAP
jgi:hypothetical protein